MMHLSATMFRGIAILAIAIFAVLAYGLFFIAAFALPETRGRILHADA